MQRTPGSTVPRKTPEGHPAAPGARRDAAPVQVGGRLDCPFACWESSTLPAALCT